MLELRLMDDVQIPQVSATNGPDWHFFGRPRMQNDSYYQGSYSYEGASATQTSNSPQLRTRNVNVTVASSEQAQPAQTPQVVYANYVTKSASGGSTAPGVPVFVLKSGMVLEVGNYTYQDGRITYELASGGTGVVSADEVDWNTTTRINSQRGVRTSLPGGHPSPGAGY
jgi:hypothetical protein